MADKKAEISFDPNDFAGMLKLMDVYGDSDSMLSGKNENGEDVNIGIYHDRIAVVTFQSNGWMRQNVYYRDGTIDETFDGRWKEGL